MDANLFCEIIESDSRIQFLRQEESLGYQFRLYESSITGKSVRIDYDDLTFTDRVGKVYLLELGLEDLIDNLYPKNPVVDVFTCHKCQDKKVYQPTPDSEFIECPDCA